MKEKIYPELSNPSAPPIQETLTNEPHLYRLKVISDIQKYLEDEIQKRDAFYKKYSRVSKIVNIIDNGLISITIAVEATGTVLIATGVGSPIGLALGISGAITGGISLIGNFVSTKTRIKAIKHLKIKTLAISKLDTINTHVSKALIDNFISDEEFKLIMDEMNKYKALKEEIKSNSKKRLKTEEQESLIERGRQEARESFRRLVEKNNTL